jgi:hypothetical protein
VYSSERTIIELKFVSSWYVFAALGFVRDLDPVSIKASQDRYFVQKHILETYQMPLPPPAPSAALQDFISVNAVFG